MMSRQHHSDITCYSNLINHLANQNLVDIPSEKRGTVNRLVYVGCDADPFEGECLEEPTGQERTSNFVFFGVGGVAGVLLLIVVAYCIVKYENKTTVTPFHVQE